MSTSTYIGAIYGFKKSSTAKVTLQNCYVEGEVGRGIEFNSLNLMPIDSTYNFGLGKGAFAVTSCVINLNSQKFCKGNNFTGYSIVNGALIPLGLSWIANGGQQVSSTKQLTDLGYTIVA